MFSTISWFSSFSLHSHLLGTGRGWRGPRGITVDGVLLVLLLPCRTMGCGAMRCYPIVPIVIFETDDWVSVKSLISLKIDDSVSVKSFIAVDENR